MDLTKKSKFLSLILRHKPEVIGLTLGEAGWVSIDALLEACGKYNKPLSKEELDEIVETDNKKRYSYDGKGNIRANQGHSVEVDLKLQPMIPPDLLYHGTGSSVVGLISTQGIKKMQRHHVHLSADYTTAEKVGQRHGKPAVFFIDSKKMHEDGVEFFCSDNGVWLTDYVEPIYFKKLISK